MLTREGSKRTPPCGHRHRRPHAVRGRPSTGRGLGRGRRRRLAGVELLDHFGGDVERGVSPDQAGIRSVEDVVEALLLADRLDDRGDPALELLLQLLLQFLDLGLRVLGGALHVDLGPFDLLGQVAARRLAHHRAALVELLLQRLGGLLLLVQLGDLLLLQRLHLGAGLLAVGRLGDHPLQDHEGDLGALGERQDLGRGRSRSGGLRRRGGRGGGRSGRLGRRGRRRSGRLGERSGARHRDEANGQNHTSHC